MQAQLSARPRFRQDLVAEPIEDAGARFIDVMDPDSGTVFRFFEVEYSIACAMDGERDVAGIVQWAKEELGLTPSVGEIRTVIATLGDLGYLDAQATDAAQAADAFSADADATTIGNQALPDPLTPTPAASAAGPAVARLALKRTPASGLPAAKQPSQPMAVVKRDDELAAGVVVGKTLDMSLPTGEFELGASGGHAAPTMQSSAVVDDFELGGAGTLVTPAEPSADSLDIPLGASGPGAAPAAVPVARDVSLDLSDQMAVGVDDVKEAVRASKVMNAVDLPKDLLAALEPEPAKPAPAPAPAAAKPPATPPARRSEPVIPVPAAAAAAAEKPAAKAATPAAKPAAAKPADKPAAAKPAVAPVAARAEAATPVEAPPSQQRRMLLLFVLLLAVAGAFFVWHYNLLGHKAEPIDVDEVTPHPIKKPVPPAPEIEKLAVSQPAAQDVKPGTIGPIDMMLANDAQVVAGALIATIGGHERLDKAVADEQQAIAKLPEEIAGFQKERAAAQGAPAIAAADKKLKDSTDRLDAHKATLATKQSELDKYQIKAPVSGKITAIAKVGARVTPADVVAKVAPTPRLVASFRIAPPMTLTSDAPVKLATQKDGKTIVCAVQVDAGTAKVTCNGIAAADGDAVTLVGQAAPGDALTGAEPGSDAGSAAGSAAAASGSSAPASGSATTTPPAAGSAATPAVHHVAAPVRTPTAAGPAQPAPAPAQPAATPTPAPTPANDATPATP